MDATFDDQARVPKALLADLRRRRDAPSAIRLAVHVSAFAGAIALVVVASGTVWILPATVLLAALMASLCAPLHECTHRTAFLRPWLNDLGILVASPFYGMAPAHYKQFHFEHHRHTQDPLRDPEIMADPARLNRWPPNLARWLTMVFHLGVLRFKAGAWLAAWFRPRRAMSAYDDPGLARRANREYRAIGCFWAAILLAGALGVTGALAVAAAFCLSHVFHGLWLSAEHTGLPTAGSILARTRTTRTHPLVRYFLWNMNLHAEHHGWPAVPWHALPRLHAIVAGEVAAERGYLALHRRVLHAALSGIEDRP